MTDSFKLSVSYSQVAVFDPLLEQPFNDWEDDQVAQGFSWRPGSVSFGTLENAGPLKACVAVGQPRDLARASRVIVVPYEVSANGVEIATIEDSGGVVKLPPGPYELTFEHGVDPQDGGMWANFIFRMVDNETVVPNVLKADGELRPPKTFHMSARPA
jgi:hypothetical protein